MSIHAQLALLPSVLLGLYLLGVVRERRVGRRWNVWRSASFSVGIMLMAAALSPPIARLAHETLNGHMVQHLLLGMFAPLGLVLGAPGTLLLRAIPASAARGIVALLATRTIRTVIHPVTVALLDIGGMYVLYLTPLFALSLESTPLHVLVHAHFLVSGYLFTWAIAGPDPAPHRPGMRIRLLVLFLATAAHAVLGKLMYAWHFPRGAGHDAAQIEAAAQLMYYGGDIAEGLLAVAFFATWFRFQRVPKRMPTFDAGRFADS